MLGVTLLQRTDQQKSSATDAIAAGKEAPTHEAAPTCPVVGIGASAGGLDAATRFFSALPPDTGMAFVLVQHLDPHHPNLLASLLASHTAMPVEQATQSTPIKPNRVYVIPPDTRIVIHKCALQLSPRGDAGAHHLPIDYFLCSLAEDQKSRAIGIILSGTASDGTAGINAIKAEGGITFAQDGSAAHPGMPESAVAAGAIDFVLPPEHIAREVARIGRHSYLGLSHPGSPVEEGPALQSIFALLRDRTGVDFTHYKKATIQRRLGRRMALHHKEHTESYLTLLDRDPTEIDALFDDLLITVTEFFRDFGAFDLLTRKAFPAMVARLKPDDCLRLWVAGCASGEEVYSIAISLLDYLEQTGQSFPVQIFGTDLSNRAIERARAGRYPEASLLKVAPERVKRFFVKLESGEYQIARRIRDLCVFSRHDLTKDPPLSRMNLVSCRNLLIYLSPILQRRVLSLFSYALEPSGVLMLGNSESLGAFADHFIPLDHDQRLYTRNLHVASTVPESLHLAAPGLLVRSPLALKGEDILTILDREADRLVLREYGPSGFLLNGNAQVVRFRGEVAPWLAPPGGPASLEVYKLVREDLLLPLRAALQESAVTETPVRKEGITVSRDGQFTHVNISVRPVSRVGGESYFLVLFENAPKPGTIAGDELSLRSPGAERELAEQLATTRSYQQSLIEELRTANEETQSTNEELQSTNEELQTAKEELQSSNEELTTTNEEMKSRNFELSRLNDDLLNLLGSLRIPIVMMNRELRIRRFTPLSDKVLNVIPSDIGRPISDLNTRLEIRDLEQIIRRVIDSAEAVEQEVRDQTGHWHSLRINPYRSGDDHVGGAVLQLLDIDQLKKTMEASEHARNYAEAILATIRQPIIVLDADFHIQTANQAFFDAFSLQPVGTLGKSVFEVSSRQWDIPEIHRVLANAAANGAQASAQADVEIEYNFSTIGWRTLRLNARALSGGGSGQLLLVGLEDITDRKTAAEARYRRLFESAKDGILIANGETGEVADANVFMTRLFGYPKEQLQGRRFWEINPFAAVPGFHEAFERLRSEDVVRFPDLSLAARDGGMVDVDVIGNIYHEGEKRVIQFNIRDITERKTFDRKLQQSAKLESLGILAGGIAHDFNNLLTGIMGNAGLVLDHLPAESSDRGLLREVLKASQRAADLTGQMLAYSGRGHFIVRPTDVSDLIRETISLVRSSFSASVDLDLRLEPDLPAVEADRSQLQQLVMNLLINAAESIPDGARGSVRVSTGQMELTADTLRMDFASDNLNAGNYVCLQIRDSGVGMDEATKSKIFDPFFTTKFTGRGLGLAAALGIVKGHRGAIRVISAPGAGSTFQVYFPASTVRLAPAPLPETPDSFVGTGLVLVVDDDAMISRIASAMLVEKGYEVVTAADGRSAVKVVEQRGNQLSLVLLDLTMPVMGGGEALDRIKKICPELPVILSSGYDQAMAMSRVNQQQVAGFIQKPYTVKNVISAVRKALQ